VVVPPVQVPLSIQTSSVPWWVAGSSPWVHHFAVYWWPFSEAFWPPVKIAVAVQAGAVQVPGGGVVGGGVVGGAVVGGAVVGGAVVGGGVGWPVQLDAEPLTSVTTSLNNVAAGSRSYSENIIAPA
jgi:hypothetical protein